MMRKYDKLASFDEGYALHESGVASSGGKYPKKPSVALIPLDGMLKYYDNLDLVVARLRTAGEQLARRYNARGEMKKALEWRDTICEHHWIGRGGRPEITIFEARLTTYGHFLSSDGRDIKPADIKVHAASRPVELTLIYLSLARRPALSS